MKKRNYVAIIIVVVLLAMTASLSLVGCSKDYTYSELAFTDLTATATTLDVSSGNANKAIDKSTATTWAPKTSAQERCTIEFGAPVEFNTVVLRENSAKVKIFHIDAQLDGEWKTIYNGENVGGYRLCSFDNITTNQLRIVIDNATARFEIKDISVYNNTVKNTNDFSKMAFVSVSSLETFLSTQESMTRLSDYLNVYNGITITEAITCDSVGNLSYLPSEDKLNSLTSSLATFLSSIDNHAKVVLNIVNSGVKYPLKLYNSCDVLVNNIVNLFNLPNIDGVNLEWRDLESTSCWRAYNYIIKELRAKLSPLTTPDGNAPTISVTLGGEEAEFQTGTIKLIDYVNYRGDIVFDQLGGFNNFYINTYKALSFLQSVGFTKAQLNLGIPFYGKSLSVKGDYLDYNAITTINAWQNIYINIQKDSYYHDYYFNSSALVRDKVTYALMLNIGGITALNLDCDLPLANPRALTNAIASALK